MPMNNRSQKPEHRKVMRAKEFLMENYRRAITLEELAKVVGLSPYHLLERLEKRSDLRP